MFFLKLFYLCHVCLGRSSGEYSPVWRLLVYRKENDQDIRTFILLVTGYILLIKSLNLKRFSFLLFQRTSGPCQTPHSDSQTSFCGWKWWYHWGCIYYWISPSSHLFQAIRLCGNLISTYQTDLLNWSLTLTATRKELR